MQTDTKLSNHHDVIVGSQRHDVHAVLEVGDEEVVDLSGVSRSKPFATQAKQPIFQEGLITGPRGFARP